MRRFCREACRADDLVLLTRTPVKLPLNELDSDTLHLLGLVVKAENHDEIRGKKVATIHVNLLTRNKGKASVNGTFHGEEVKVCEKS